MTDKTTRFIAIYARLEPRTEWAGGRLADTDLVTLDEAARFASRHSGEEVAPADFLRAAARGEIPLRALCPRHVTMQPTQAGREPLDVHAGSLPTLPLSACQALSITGRARWRTYEAPERLETFGGAWGYFAAWRLPDDEPDLETVVADCRVTGHDVHALADAFREPPPLPTAETDAAPASAEPAHGTPAPAEPTAHIEPVARWQAQELTILNKLRELGYSSRALPKSEAWTPGAKAKVRAAIGAVGMWHSPKVFDKAWERLRERGEIADKP